MKVGYVVTLYIDENTTDLEMTRECLESLTYSDDVCLFIYNQGCLSTNEIHLLLSPYNFEYYILGSGENVGIPKARYVLIDYILKNHPEIEYIAEIHLDMIFMPNWHKPLISFLDSNADPMICPRIIKADNNNFYVQDTDTLVTLPNELDKKIFALEDFTEDAVIFNFTNPVIYKSEALRGVNFYDTGFLTGMQTFEDTSLLIGFSYYMGTRSNWKPKCYLNSCVFHKIEGQRLRVMTEDDYNKNLHGLITQYGAYGIQQWYKMDGNEYWNEVYQSMIIDKTANK